MVMAPPVTFFGVVVWIRNKRKIPTALNKLDVLEASISDLLPEN